MKKAASTAAFWGALASASLADVADFLVRNAVAFIGFDFSILATRGLAGLGVRLDGGRFDHPSAALRHDLSDGGQVGDGEKGEKTKQKQSGHQTV
jgi:hypothetical protein